MNLAIFNGIALRRLDGIFIETSGDTPTMAQGTDFISALRLLGYKLSDADSAKVFEASKTSLDAAIEAIKAPLLPSQKRSFTQAFNKLESGVLVEVDSSKLKSLKLVEKSDLAPLGKRIAEQAMPFNEKDINDLVELHSFIDFTEVSSTSVENNVTLRSLFDDYDWSKTANAKSVLRMAAVWSGGDASLSENVKFKLSRPKRKELLRVLETLLSSKGADALFDIARNREEWKRLMTALRPGDYPWAIETSAVLSSVYAKSIPTLNGRMDHVINARNVKPELLVERLSESPGVFARRLAEVLRKHPELREEILESFKKVSGRVSTRVLIQARNHFAGPLADEVPEKPVTFKSRTLRNGFLKNRLEVDQSDVVEAIDAGLSEKLAGMKVFIEGYPGIKILTSNRSASPGARIVGRGSRIAVPEGPYLALFNHWSNISDDDYSDRVDIDLAGGFFNENFSERRDIAYYNSSEGFGNHSGDITNAPNGAEEFVRIDRMKALDAGYRYVLMSVYNYTGQALNSVPENYAGVAVVDSLSGEFTAADVEARFDIQTVGRETIPLIFDMKTSEIIWVDMAFAGMVSNGNLKSSPNAVATIKSVVNSKDLTVGDLVEISGASLVDSADHADMVIDPRMADQVLELLK